MKSDSQDIGNQPTGLMATSHVDGSAKVYRFNSFDELDNKHKENRPDIVFKDHFYSCNQVTFAQNTKGMDGEDIP